MGTGKLSAAILGFGIAVASAGPALALRAQDMVGRWGVASYFAQKDAAATQAAAHSACGEPYSIRAGTHGGVIMYSAFSGKPVELAVTGDRLVAPADHQGLDDRIILSGNAGGFVLRYASPESAQRYGTMVFVRCGR